MKKKDIAIMIIGNLCSKYKYMNIGLLGLFPFYLTTNGNQTIIETKLDELLKSYRKIYLVENNPEYNKLLKDFIWSTNEKFDKYQYVNVINLVEMYNLTNSLNVDYIKWNDIRNESEQRKYLENLSSDNTCRFFNEIKFDINKVHKIAKTKDAIKLQKIENEFYDKYGKYDCFCNKLDYDENNHELVLEKIDGHTVQQYYELNTGYAMLINKFKNTLKDLNSIPIDIVDSDKDIYDAFYNELYSKIQSRVLPCSDLIYYFMTSTGVETIDGMKITKNFGTLLSKIDHWFKDNYSKFKACLCHGDPNTDNVMFTTDGKMKFIDPRGYFGNLKTIGLGLPEYDMAKFCYGLNGYSKFNRSPYISCSLDLDKNLRVQYPNIVKANGRSITQIDLCLMDVDDNVKIMIGIIWMKLTSYIINDPMKGIIAYLYGNAICTKYLNQLGY